MAVVLDYRKPKLLEMLLDPKLIIGFPLPEQYREVIMGVSWHEFHVMYGIDLSRLYAGRDVFTQRIWDCLFDCCRLEPARPQPEPEEDLWL